MENLIKKVYQEKMNDGTIEKIVGEKFNEMVKAACDDLFRWNGPVKKQLEEKLKDVTSGLVERTDFSKYVTKMQYIINEALENSAAADYKEIAESLKAILGQKQIESFSKIKASELFKKYCDYIKNVDFSKIEVEDHVDVDYDDGYPTAYLTCEMALDYTDTKLVFECNDVDNSENYRFEISINRDNEIRFKPKIDITDYKHLDDFTCYLLMLSNNWVKVEFDERALSEDIEINIEE